MCTFIIYIFPVTCSEKVRAEVFRILEIRVKKYDGKHIRPAFSSQETLWLRRDNCDCGTIVGSGADKCENMIKRYQRKGWSEAKIAGAVSQHLVNRITSLTRGRKR